MEMTCSYNNTHQFTTPQLEVPNSENSTTFYHITTPSTIENTDSQSDDYILIFCNHNSSHYHIYTRTYYGQIRIYSASTPNQP